MKNNFNISGLSKFVDIEGLDKDSTVSRKQYISDLEINVDEEKTCIAKINTLALDSDGDIVMPSGCDLSRYKSNAIVCWSHDYSIPAIGKVIAIDVKEDGIHAKIKFADTERGNEIWQLIKGGFIKGNSVGFIINKAVTKGTKAFDEYVTSKALKVGRECKRIVTDWMLLENSIVNLGANPEALMQAISAKSINISDKLIKDLDMLDKDAKTINSMDINLLAELIAKKLQAKEVKVNPYLTETVLNNIKEYKDITGVDVLKMADEAIESISVTVEPKAEVVEVVEPIIPAPVIVDELVEFNVVDEAIELTEEEKLSIIAEVEEELKSIAQGKII